MRLYTRTGDDGTTHLLDGRVQKDDLRVEVCGTIDELNAFIGEAIGRLHNIELRQILQSIQHQLFELGADLARTEKDAYLVNQEMVVQLEAWIDQFDQECPVLEQFILPGGTLAASALHICRVVCRRAERRAVSLDGQHKINPAIRRYLNRLSDLFFVLARVVNLRANVSEIEYQSKKKRSKQN